MPVTIEFKPQDLWIGAFWKTQRENFLWSRVDLWVCLIPCVPIHFTWRLYH